jgi:hypothetical protein
MTTKHNKKAEELIEAPQQTTEATESVASPQATEAEPQEMLTATQQISEQTQPGTEVSSNPYEGATTLLAAPHQMLGAEMQAAQEKQEQRHKDYTDAVEAFNKAQAEGHSGMLALLDANRPKYDKDKEKRLRNTAIIQSLGDMLTNAARGFFAFRKGKGQGYVPNIADNSPLRSLEELNRMRKEYQEREEAWKTLKLNFDIQQEQAKIAAAEKLATRAYEEVKRGDDALQKYKELALKYGQDVAEFFAKQIFADAEAEREREFKAKENAENRALRKSEGAANRASRERIARIRQEQGEMSEADAIALEIYLKRNPLPGKEVVKSGTRKQFNKRTRTYEDVPYADTTRTATTFLDLDKEEKKSILARAKADRYAQAYATVIVNGYDEATATAVAEKVKNGQDINTAFTEVINE